ncbi:MAG TPA: AAA family ATPase, partial [Candidatus Acidoferrum sp.]|nr:AAA family ATPase [Candidatus Acidoferrum sp.]
MNTMATRLAAFGLTHHQIESLADKFGNNTLVLLQSNPYLIIGDIRNFGFKRVDKIARQMGTAKSDPSRVRAGIIHCVNEALDQGHCWTEMEDLIDQANLLLVMDDLDSREVIDRELSRMLDEGILACDSYSGRFVVALPKIRSMEQDLAGWLRQGQDLNPHFSDQEDLAGWVEHTGSELNEKQREGVLNAMRHRLSLITGPAGSGKTRTISCINEICEEGEISVVLAALTGKAAQRIEQMVNRKASTIHRLLGFNGKEYALGPDNPIDADVAIIDEFSVVDVPLAWHLFRAIDLSRTAVVLVGDHNQLPPVGPGNILRDLVRSRVIPMVILDQVVRQAGVLKENCMAVLSGEVRKTSGPAENPSAPRPWYMLDRHTDQADAQRCLLGLFEHDLKDRLGFDLITDVQLLTSIHKGPLGTHDLNMELQRVVQRKLWNVDAPPPLPG